MVEKSDIASRIITGPVLIFTGLVIYTALVLLCMINTSANIGLFDTVVFFLALEPYWIIAGLFVLTGVQYVAGPKAWIDRLITNSLRRRVVISAAISLVIIGALVVILLFW